VKPAFVKMRFRKQSSVIISTSTKVKEGFMNRTYSLRSNSVRWLLCVFAALLALRAADAALVFQDRHTDPDGAQIVYSFETNSQETASPVDQTRATKIATSWAAKFYKLLAPSVVSVQTRTMPIRFWLIQLSAPVAGKRETFFAVVLPNGSVVEPTARRSIATVALIDRDPIIPFVDPAAAPNKLEIHGEISFTYGFGKGSGCADRYLNPAWNSPAWPRGIEP
jgi:hypothetical protein